MIVFVRICKTKFYELFFLYWHKACGFIFVSKKYIYIIRLILENMMEPIEQDEMIHQGLVTQQKWNVEQQTGVSTWSGKWPIGILVKWNGTCLMLGDWAKVRRRTTESTWGNKWPGLVKCSDDKNSNIDQLVGNNKHIGQLPQDADADERTIVPRMLWHWPLDGNFF